MVTPDGVVRKANAKENTDLFWAMRGGGGGAWGVATQTVIQVFEGELHFPAEHASGSPPLY